MRPVTILPCVEAIVKNLSLIDWNTRLGLLKNLNLAQFKFGAILTAIWSILIR